MADKKTSLETLGAALDNSESFRGSKGANNYRWTPSQFAVYTLAYNAQIAAIAGLTSAANKGISFTGAGAAATYDLTAAGLALLDDADAAAQRTTLGLGTAATLASDTDVALTANSDARLATQKAVKAYVDAIVTGGASDVMIFKGVIDASANPNYPAADAGNLYKISVAGKIGGASGPNVEAGDTIYCITDATATGNHATVGANWVISQVNTDGAVIGPGSATNNNVALFDGATGKLIKDSGLAISALSVASAATLTTPRTIGGVSFDGSANITQPYDVHASYPGVPTASAYLLPPTKAARALAVPANFANSTFTATANATASTVFTVLKNGSSIGTATIAAGTVTPTFATSGGAAQSYAAGDTYAVQAPATPDATLAEPSFVFVFTR